MFICRTRYGATCCTAWLVLRLATFLANCLARDDHMREMELFHWVMPQLKRCDTIKLHYVTTENFVAVWREALPKVELTSTSRNDCGKKKLRGLFAAGCRSPLLGSCPSHTSPMSEPLRVSFILERHRFFGSAYTLYNAKILLKRTKMLRHSPFKSKTRWVHER